MGHFRKKRQNSAPSDFMKSFYRENVWFYSPKTLEKLKTEQFPFAFLAGIMPDYFGAVCIQTSDN